MPAKLREPWEPVKWRVDVADMELLRLLFPGQVNNVVRQVLNAYCANLRKKGFGQRENLPVDDRTNFNRVIRGLEEVADMVESGE